MRREDRKITDNIQIEEIIRKSDVCRIALADNNIPYLVTMNFGYSEGENSCLWFHCATEGRMLELLKKNNYVYFQMDTDHEIIVGEKACDWGMKFSSVAGYGRIIVIDDKETKIYGLNCIMGHYSDRTDFYYEDKQLLRTAILRLDIEQITAKKI